MYCVSTTQDKGVGGMDLHIFLWVSYVRMKVVARGLELSAEGFFDGVRYGLSA